MTKSQPLKEFSELVLPKKRLRMKKVKVPELVLPKKRLRKKKVSVPPTPLVIEISLTGQPSAVHVD